MTCKQEKKELKGAIVSREPGWSPCKPREDTLAAVSQGLSLLPLHLTIALLALQSPTAQAQPFYRRGIKLGSEEAVIKTGDPV